MIGPLVRFDEMCRQAGCHHCGELLPAQGEAAINQMATQRGNALISLPSLICIYFQSLVGLFTSSGWKSISSVDRQPSVAINRLENHDSKRLKNGIGLINSWANAEVSFKPVGRDEAINSSNEFQLDPQRNLMEM